MKFEKPGKILGLVCLSIMFVLTACQGPAKFKAQDCADQAAQMLGTLITGKAYGANAQDALGLAFDRVKEIEDKMSRYRSGSEVDLINQSGKEETTPISPDTFFVIEKALRYAAKTKGAFNPLIGEIVDLWGIGRPDARVPSDQEINRFLPHLGHDQLELTRDPYRARLTSDLVKLDLGAIAKGYAADQMREVLLEEGINSALLNLGGNVIVIGSKPGGDLWSIGVQNPLAEDRGEIAGVIKAKDTSVVTSGSYERFFLEDGIRYHHIIDPFTGAPAQNGVISSTIITQSSADADALSTAVYVLGKDKGLALIESIPSAEAIIITDDRNVYTSSGITDDIFQLKSEDFIYEKNR